MKNLVVGQEVFGIGFLDGKVVSVSPTIDVQTADGYPVFFFNSIKTARKPRPADAAD
jgi:hypothetical protein